MREIEGRYLIDTNVLIYATLEQDSRTERARAAIANGAQSNCEAYISVQNLSEMYPNLTGPKTLPPDTPEQAAEKISRLAGLPYLQVLPITPAVILKALQLAEQRQVRRQRFFDMQLAATLLVHDIPTLVTENTADFVGIEGIEAISPFE